jgi:hypothetical protein
VRREYSPGFEENEREFLGGAAGSRTGPIKKTYKFHGHNILYTRRLRLLYEEFHAFLLILFA